MDTKEYEVVFLSELNNVKSALKGILEFCNEIWNLSKEEEGDLKLIFSELLCNAVIHGNKHDADKRVYVHVYAKDGTLSSKITDEGTGFDGTTISANINLLSDHGRGVRLAASLADHINFGEFGNTVQFDKKIQSGER
ncbi:hypothetical protein AGMMS49975_09350 [Clostridia bacterium]|nr:hypothetical protein AGMMS49975_09350 [Clostridia bacterium]